MRRVLVLFYSIFSLSVTLSATEEGADKKFTWTPYKCTFIPSQRLRSAVRVKEGSDFVVRWAAEKEEAMRKTENACAGIAAQFEHDDEECFSHTEETLKCRKKFQGYYEF